MMQRIFPLCLALLVSAAHLHSETVYTTRTNNPLREGPGAYYGLILSVPDNTPLGVIERSGNWVKVRLPDKRGVWVAANCVTEKKSERLMSRSLENVWSSPKASKTGITAAIKGFGKKFGKTEPGNVDKVLRHSEKEFSNKDLASFTQAIRQQASSNRARLQLTDLNLESPEYYATLPEQEIGVGVAARIAQSGIREDKALHRYLNMICATLAENSSIYDWDLTVIVLKDRAVNSYAIPGGYIFVTLGALMQCKDESELAGLIAHEIAHIYRRHGLQEMSKRIVKIRADDAFMELAEEAGGSTEDDKEMEQVVDQTYEKIVHPRLLAYELEADKIGAVLAANAGYDPFGLVRISDRFARISAEKPDIFDPNFMLPDDAAIRFKETNTFAEKNFTKKSPGARLELRFNAFASSVH